MNYMVLVSEQAEQDLRDIFEYIAFDLLSPENARAQLDRLEQAIVSLDTFPQRNKQYAVEPWKSRNLRVMPVDHYCVFYIPDSTQMTVTVIRVIYGGRDIEEQMNRITDYEETKATEKEDHYV